MLRKGPIGHDKSGDHKEDIPSNGLRRNVETQPLINLRSVICTSNDVEQEAARNLISSIPIWAPKIPQQDMTIKVRNLTKQRKSEANLHLEVTNRSVKRMVDIISNVCTKAPIIGTVPENIRKGRGCMAETVHKKCFHNSFEVVETPAVQSTSLYRVDDALPFVAKVTVHRKEVKDGIEDQGTEVLPEEKSTVRNLWSKVLEYNS